MSKRRKQYYEDHSTKKLRKSEYSKECKFLLKYNRDALLALHSNYITPFSMRKKTHAYRSDVSLTLLQLT